MAEGSSFTDSLQKVGTDPNQGKQSRDKKKRRFHPELHPVFQGPLSLLGFPMAVKNLYEAYSPESSTDQPGKPKDPGFSLEDPMVVPSVAEALDYTRNTGLTGASSGNGHPVFTRQQDTPDGKILSFSDIGPDGKRYAPQNKRGQFDPGQLLQNTKKALGVSEYAFNTDPLVRKQVRQVAARAFIDSQNFRGQQQGVQGVQGVQGGAGGTFADQFTPAGKLKTFGNKTIDGGQATSFAAQSQLGAFKNIDPQTQQVLYSKKAEELGDVLKDSANPALPTIIAGMLPGTDTTAMKGILTSVRASRQPIAELGNQLNLRINPKSGAIVMGGPGTVIDEQTLDINSIKDPTVLQMITLAAQHNAIRKQSLQQSIRDQVGG